MGEGRAEALRLQEATRLTGSSGGNLSCFVQVAEIDSGRRQLEDGVAGLAALAAGPPAAPFGLLQVGAVHLQQEGGAQVRDQAFHAAPSILVDHTCPKATVRKHR